MLTAIRLALLALFMAAGSHYSGNWSSSVNSSGGTLDLRLKPEPALSFAMTGGETVTCKIVASKVEEPAFEMTCEFEGDGDNLRSTLAGAVSGEKVEGKYTTKAGDGRTVVDSGTFRATLAK